MKSEKKIVLKTFSQLSMAEATGRHANLLIHSNAKFNLICIWDKDQERVHRFEVVNKNPTPQEAEEMITLRNSFEPDRLESAIDSMKRW